MSDTMSVGEAPDIPEFPMPRAEGCPFAPPPVALERAAAKQLFRVRSERPEIVVLPGPDPGLLS